MQETRVDYVPPPPIESSKIVKSVSSCERIVTLLGFASQFAPSYMPIKNRLLWRLAQLSSLHALKFQLYDLFDLILEEPMTTTTTKAFVTTTTTTTTTTTEAIIVAEGKMPTIRVPSFE